MKEEIVYDAINFEYDEEHKLDHRVIKIIHHKIKKVIMKDQFTIEEIRKYLLSQDSMGDIMYNLSAENIIKANEIKLEDNISYDEIENYFHCDRCGADLNEACSCGELDN